MKKLLAAPFIASVVSFSLATSALASSAPFHYNNPRQAKPYSDILIKKTIDKPEQFLRGSWEPKTKNIPDWFITKGGISLLFDLKGVEPNGHWAQGRILIFQDNPNSNWSTQVRSYSFNAYGLTGEGRYQVVTLRDKILCNKDNPIYYSVRIENLSKNVPIRGKTVWVDPNIQGDCRK